MRKETPIAVALFLLAALAGCTRSTPYDEWQYDRIQRYFDQTDECLARMKEDLHVLTKRYSPGQEPPAPILREHLASLASNAAEQDERTKGVCREIRAARPEVRKRALSSLEDGAGLKTQRGWLSDPLAREVLKEAKAEVTVRHNVESIERFVRELRAGGEEEK